MAKKTMSKAQKTKMANARRKVDKCLREKHGKKDKATGKKVLTKAARKRITVAQRAACGSKSAKAQLKSKGK